MTTPLIRTVHVGCPPDHAFTVFTSRVDDWWPHSHRRFPQSRIQLEAHPEGTFTERSPDGQEIVLGRVIRCDPPNHITYTWNPGSKAGPTTVDVRFEAKDDQTLVTVTHSEGESGLGDAWNDLVKKFIAAWGEVLPAFANYATEQQPNH